MATVQPPPPPATPAAATPSSATTAQVVKAPPELSQVKLGESVPAKLMPPEQAPSTQATSSQGAQGQPSAAGQAGAQSAQPVPPGQVQVQTPYGTVTLQTHLPLPQNATLHLTLTSLKPPVFQIGLVDGKPVGTTQTAQTNAATTGLPPAPSPLAEGTRVGATLVRPITVPATAATAQSGQSAAQPQPPQATPVATTTAATAPQTATTPSTTTVPATGAQQPTPTPPQPSASPNAAPQGNAGSAAAAGQTGQTGTPPPASPNAHVTLPSGTRLSVTVVRIVPPQAPPGTPASSAAGLNIGNTVTGTVTGTTAQGQPIVQTPHATIALGTRASVPVGSQVMLRVETAPVIPEVPEGAKLGRSSGPVDSLMQSRTWPDLDEALKTVLQADPSRLQHIAQHILPQTGAKLSSQMLFFLSALKGGDIKGWLGDSTVRLIERDRPLTLNRVSGDFQTMSKLADDPQPGDWRLALVPMWNGKEIEQLRMYYRGGDGEDGDEGENDGTRFILDVELSNLGHMQIDGLVKAEQKNLDLIVRSQMPLPDDWRTDIGELVNLAQELVGLKGGVAFQSSPDTFVEFQANDIPPSTPGLLV